MIFIFNDNFLFLNNNLFLIKTFFSVKRFLALSPLSVFIDFVLESDALAN